MSREFSDEILEKARRVEEKCGPEAIEEMKHAYNTAYDEIVAITENNKDFMDLLPYVASIEIGKLNAMGYVQSDDVTLRLFGELALEEISVLISVLTRLTYYRGYKQGQRATALGNWVVADEGE